MGGWDAIGVVERCYQLEGSVEPWLTRLAEALRPLLDEGLGINTGLLWRKGYGRLEWCSEVYFGPPEVKEFLRRRFRTLGPEGLEFYFRCTPAVDIARETMEKYGLDARDYEQDSPPGLAIRDHVTLLARDGSDLMVGVNACSEQEIQISRQRRGTLRKLSWHLSAGLRLLGTSRAPDGEAVLTPEGRCLHAEGRARARDARSALREAARVVDRARGSLRRREPEGALDLWKGLVSGRWSLVDRFESDGRRYVIAHRNDPRYLDPRRLTRREQQCARLAGLGYSNGELAYSLGLSESAVRSHVGAALRKLRLSRREDLAETLEPAPLEDVRLGRLGEAAGEIRVASAPATPPVPEDAGLTPAEREVTEGLLRGNSLREIGRARNTSDRTVANQIQSIYRKLDVGSRDELAHRLRARS